MANEDLVARVIATIEKDEEEDLPTSPLKGFLRYLQKEGEDTQQRKKQKLNGPSDNKHNSNRNSPVTVDPSGEVWDNRIVAITEYSDGSCTLHYDDEKSRHVPVPTKKNKLVQLKMEMFLPKQTKSDNKSTTRKQTSEGTTIQRESNALKTLEESEKEHRKRYEDLVNNS